ncbi:acyl-CoA thioesterase domain-containing protein [Gordonia malaquae]|jgi:hypothetical protein|uniref:acyl-CoA thioesterase domain-containing protein n=1 Tax=Gordonia malaquae TaxID=410332 RepID=UPI0030C798F1
MAFFTVRDDTSLHAEPLAISPWSATQVGGYAVCGALARAVEAEMADSGLSPLRFTVDLVKPVRSDGFTTRTTVVRRGPRMSVVDAAVVQDGEVRARATSVFVVPSDEPPGELWQSADPLPTPPEGADAVGPPLISSGHNAWSRDYRMHQNAGRKSAWQTFPPLVAGEDMTPFQRAVTMSETTSLVCHWGTEGAGFINTDATLALVRLPIGGSVGLRADSQVSSAGLSVGTATMFDRHGVVGHCTVTAIANARRQVDLGGII